eukprot:TRINITY_DN2079_c0_g2_i1.p1 TRINITY_DN2079_c0_g2~~TRINITY_DN2079_c0_g2_i1.p1  ORF type:complete len:257 (+),score=6.17 TRINITY_DN2079_c0_g2_i1:144-914(+)
MEAWWGWPQARGSSLPYLFTIIMDYLSRSLIKMALDPRFPFHPKCKRLGITHLCYANDLFLFYKIEDSSLRLLKTIIDHFKDVLGLEANPSKSHAFFGGISQWQKERLLQILEYTEGTLPVKYLGIPLNSKKLPISDCIPLTLMVVGKIRSWTSKFLSYAGRCTLIKAVLQSLASVWCRVFILPNKVIHEINSLCRRFLWTVNPNQSRKALIAWKSLVKLKRAGGLGLTDPILMNTTLICSQLWDLTHRKETLWIK